MLLFKTYTLEFEFDRHLEHMVSYQGTWSGLLCYFLINSTFWGSFCKNDCLVKPDFSYFSNYKHESKVPYRRLTDLFAVMSGNYSSWIC